MHHIIRDTILSALGLLSPCGCFSCKRPLWRPEICDRCRPQTIFDGFPRCDQCFSPLWTADASGVCSGCRRFTIPRIRYCWEYEARFRRCMHLIKFSHHLRLAREMILHASALLSFEHRDRSYSAIVPVPPSRVSASERGFHLPAMFAVALSKEIGAPTRCGALKIRRERSAQRLRTRDDRMRGLRRWFRTARPVTGRVLLVDDVLTTGATMWAAGNALLDAGATEVDYAVLGRASHTWLASRHRLGRIASR